MNWQDNKRIKRLAKKELPDIATTDIKKRSFLANLNGEVEPCKI